MQSDNAIREQEEISIHLTKNRIAAVDITRILAAFLVMFEHIAQFRFGGGVEGFIGAFLNVGIGTVSPIFFVFAGYFACRNITWKKAFTNSLWCLIPYVIWNVAAIATNTATMVKHGDTWAQIVESFHLFASDSILLGEFDRPLWFMRNLIFLFLLAPIVYKWAKYITPILILCMFFPTIESCFGRDSFLRGSYSFYFFALGCFLRTFPKEKQNFLLRFHSPFMLVCYWGIVLFITLNNVVNESIWSWHMPSVLGETLGLWMLYQTARWLEVTFPPVVPVALKYAPVTFLTFAVHWIVMKHTPALFQSTIIAGMIPLAIFALMAVFFFTLKRWARPLLHPVAHYKLRPDDLQPARKG